MQFGVYFPFRNPPQWQRPWEEVYRESLEQMALAEQLGFDAVWLTEHHAVPEPQLVWLYVGRDNDSAWKECEPYARHVYDYYRRWTLEAGHPDWWSSDPRDHFLAGDAEYAVRAIRERLGGFRRPGEQIGEHETEHIVLGMPLPGMPDALVRGSLERFAERVMPVLR